MKGEVNYKHPSDDYLESIEKYNLASNYWVNLLVKYGVLTEDWIVVRGQVASMVHVDVTALLQASNPLLKRTFRFTLGSAKNGRFFLGHLSKCEYNELTFSQLNIVCAPTSKIESLIVFIALAWSSPELSVQTFSQLLDQFLEGGVYEEGPGPWTEGVEPRGSATSSEMRSGRY